MSNCRCSGESVTGLLGAYASLLQHGLAYCIFFDELASGALVCRGVAAAPDGLALGP